MSEVFVITGAASGIGRGVCGELARRGKRVLATDIDRDGLAAAADGWRGGEVMTAFHDVRSAADWRRVMTQAIERWGAIDVVMNVAGYARAGLAHELDDEEIDRHIDVNAKGAMLGSKIAAEHMVAQGHGHIVNVASLAGVAATPGIAMYSASKFAIRGFSLALAQELAAHRVAVTVVGPDVVDTPMIAEQLDQPEAAYSFSGSRVLRVAEVRDLLVGEVLERRPLEVLLPRRRGWLCKLVSAAPTVARALAPFVERRGRARQARERARRSQSQ